MIIIILLLIELVSILSTIIEQDQSIETYKLNYPLTNKLFGILSWDIIIKFGLDHVYKTWWFICLIFLFGISLLTCTFLQQIPSLKIARRCQFFRTSKQFSKLKVVKRVTNVSFNKLLFQLKQNQYSIFQQKGIFYCYKGLIGRLAPLVVHFSMIFILLGSIVGAIGGFKAQEIIPKTEVFHVQNLLNSGEITIIPKISMRINDFWITYNKQQVVSQFFSDLSFLTTSGNEIKRETIFVNSPAIFDSIYCYQLDWNLVGFRLYQDSLNINQYPLINILTQQNKLWLSWIPINSNLTDGVIFLLNSYNHVYSMLSL